MTQRALILHPYLKRPQNSSLQSRTVEGLLAEAKGLAKAINLEIFEAEPVALNKQIPATYIGKGKVEEYQYIISSNEIDLVIIDTSISPIQQRNLETAWKCKVIDRTALILEIFGARAQTKEGRLQVELASLDYQKSRLVRSWTHLERQRGGSGFLGGPGETQIESDRRAIRDKMGRIRNQLKKVVKTRTLHRTARKKIPYPIVALAGYTNAGKSTLFNLVTDAEVLAKDILFATLDPTMRVLKLPSGQKIILSDTVGFISNLPTELVAAFSATLEEVVEADIIIHVRDISDPDTQIQKEDVFKVLGNLVNEETLAASIIEAQNKIDLLNEESQQEIFNRCKSEDNVVAISAINKTGIEYLLNTIDKKIQLSHRTETLSIKVSFGKTLAWIHANAEVIDHAQEEDIITLTIRIAGKEWGRLQTMDGIV